MILSLAICCLSLLWVCFFVCVGFGWCLAVSVIHFCGFVSFFVVGLVFVCVGFGWRLSFILVGLFFILLINFLGEVYGVTSPQPMTLPSLRMPHTFPAGVPLDVLTL